MACPPGMMGRLVGSDNGDGKDITVLVGKGLEVSG